MKKNYPYTLFLGLTIFVFSATATFAQSLVENTLSANTMLKASYIDMLAPGSLAAISASAYKARNILIFGFAKVSTDTLDPVQLNVIKTAVNNEIVGTLNFLSLGGERGHASEFTNIPQVISNVAAQITQINLHLLAGKKINGVDLDLEGAGWTSAMINQLALGFKAKGLLVSAAPQVYLAYEGASNNVDPTHPINLGLTTAGASNVYGQAVAEGHIDYLFAQTYNTVGWTVGGHNESEVAFFRNIAQALNTAVKADCEGVSTLCIKAGTKILIGEPSNASGGGFSIFNKTGASPIPAYEQAGILNTLRSEVGDTLSAYSNIKGVMEWSLNNDAAPALYNDPYAKGGAFGKALFGEEPMPLPYFILQVSNTGTALSASATLIVNTAYYVFADQGDKPLLPKGSQSWGTQTSSQNPLTPWVKDSSNLNIVFAGGVKSFTTSHILINGYKNTIDQGECNEGKNYTFESGHSYHLMINADTKKCALSKVN